MLPGALTLKSPPIVTVEERDTPEEVAVIVTV
jgi:hypothetical protein